MEENTTLWISKKANQKLDKIIKALRVFNKKGFIEEIIQVFSEAIEQLQGNGATFILLAKPRITKKGIVFPIQGISDVVFGVIPCRMDLTDEQADRLVEKEVKKKFKEMEKNE